MDVGRSRWLIPAMVATISCGDWAEDSPEQINEAGGSASLDHGRLGVDDVTEMVFVVRRGRLPSACWFCSEGELAAAPGRLFGVRADSDDVVTVAYVTGLADLRMLFPRDGLLVMGERWEGDTYKGDELRLIDRTTFVERERNVVSRMRFLEPTVSPDDRWVAAFEGDSSGGDLTVIDASTLDATVMNRNMQVVGMDWVGEGDRLVALVREGHSCRPGCTVETDPRVRLLSWSVGALSAAGFPRTSDGVWDGADVDITLSVVLGPGDVPIVGASLAVDPVAGVVAIAYRALTWAGLALREAHQESLLVDLNTGATQRLDGIGSVMGFVPDGGPLAATACDDVPDPTAPDRCTFVLLDRTTLAAEAPSLPAGAASSLLFPPDGRRFLVPIERYDPGRNPLEGPTIRELFLYDVERHRLVDFAGPPIGLSNLTFRPGEDELWAVDRGLFRIDLLGGVIETVPFPGVPTSINYLPDHGLLAVSQGGNRVAFIDPGSGAVVSSVDIPAVY